MKRFILSVIVAGLMAQFAFADGHDDDLMYSCNPVVHKAVVSNLQTVRKMNRETWLKLRQDFKRAVYRAFTPTQRKNLWLGKFAELRQLPWSQEELAHIKKVEDFMNEHDEIYADKKLTDEEENVIDLFFANWSKEAESSLGWDRRIAISIAGTPCRTTDTKGSVELVKKGLVLKYKDEDVSVYGESAPTDIIDTTDYTGGTIAPEDTTSTDGVIECNCADEFLQDFCIPLSCDSKWIKCIIKEKACGWGWNKDCNGLCI